MMVLAENHTILMTRDGRGLVFNEKSTGRIEAVLTDEAAQPIQASQLSALKLWLYVRDDATKPIINSVSDVSILNDGTRGVIGNNKTITGASNAEPIVVTITGHGYSSGDLIVISGVVGNRAANGTWTITVLDVNTFELVGSRGDGAWTSGGVAVKALHLTLQPNDNQILTAGLAIDAWEWHEAYILATFGGKQLPYTIAFPVRNLAKAS